MIVETTAAKAIVGVAVGALVIGGGAVLVGVVNERSQPSRVTVTSIVDGDTIDVSVDGVETRVRFLNVDAPEMSLADQSVECGGPEAIAFLEQLIPAGTQVRLEYDEDRTDPYGRDLAGVYVGEKLVNAELARVGLGAAVLFEPNHRFYAEVLEAQNEAMAARVGLYDAEMECTYPAQIEALNGQVEQLLIAGPAAQDLPGMEGYLGQLAAVVVAGDALSGLVSPWTPWDRC